MNFVIDESVVVAIPKRLRADGHEVFVIAEVMPSISDEAVLHEAWSRGAIVITEDKDFGALVFEMRHPHAGVLLYRLPGTNEDILADQVCGVTAEMGDALADRFTVVTESHVRTR